MIRVSIGIGEFYVATQPTVISTILGSCVSVCLYDPVRKLGGMNHILLPGSPDMKHFNASARYGINAMELLINGMLKAGGRRSDLKTKVFGGGHVFDNGDGPQVFTPGKDNADFVFTFLENERIPVESYNVGGNFGRKIHFDTATGQVLMKRIKALSSLTVRQREERFRRSLSTEAVRGRGVVFLDGKSEREKG